MGYPSNKTELRKHFIAQRKQIIAEQQEIYSEAIRQQLSSYLNTHNPDAILMYYALGCEVDTRPFFQSGYTSLYAPCILEGFDMQWLAIDSETSWQQSLLGVLEPTSGQKWQAKEQNTILICPLVAFDRLGNRLGMGKGYFDRWLEKNKHHISEMIGLAFSSQESTVTIPVEPHDQPLHTIITEQEIIICRTH